MRLLRGRVCALSNSAKGKFTRTKTGFILISFMHSGEVNSSRHLRFSFACCQGKVLPWCCLSLRGVIIILSGEGLGRQGLLLQSFYTRQLQTVGTF